MGLASSQARLLNLTGRMHQIEYKAAKLEAEKLQMANESTRVYQEYQNALEKTKIQVKTLNTDGSATYKDIDSYENLLKAGYAIEYNGTIYDGSSSNNSFVGMPPGWDTANSYTVTEQDIANGTYADYNIQMAGTYNYCGGGTWSCSGTSKTLNYAQLCHDAFGASLSSPPSNVSKVVTNLINSGDCIIITKDKNGKFTNKNETSVSTNTGLQEVTDESGLRKAEAKYEADMKRIDNKDKKYDYDLAALDNERNAIKQEMETLKTVSKDNVERTFKLFS